MQYIFFVFACALTFASRAQADKNPYQVLDCRSTVDENGLPVKRFELIGPRQRLRISDDGYCILVHCTGQSFEFKGDTVIFISDLRVQNTCGTYEFPVRPMLKELFDPVIIAGARHRDQLAMLIPPPRSNFVLGINDDLCLQWEPWNGAQGYIVKVSSTGGTSLLSDIKTDTNMVTIPRSQIPKASLPDNVILVDIFLDNRKFKISSVAIEVDWAYAQRSFFSCPTTAFQALMIAHYLELSLFQKQAENFYQLAASRSSLPVYQELLERFRDRLENR